MGIKNVIYFIRLIKRIIRFIIDEVDKCINTDNNLNFIRSDIHILSWIISILLSQLKALRFHYLTMDERDSIGFKFTNLNANKCSISMKQHLITPNYSSNSHSYLDEPLIQV